MVRIGLGGVLTAASVLLLTSCPGHQGQSDLPEDLDFRQAMRDFVQAISAHAKERNPAFVIIPQNGAELVSRNPDEAGPAASRYLAAIDGQGQEDLIYGYNGDNQATPGDERDYLFAFLDLAETQGVEVLVTDYVDRPAGVDASLSANEARGYVSFAADSRDLDTIPSYPNPIQDENSRDILDLGDASNFLYLIDPSNFSNAGAMLNAIAATNYDVVILDAFFDDAALREDELARIRNKANGGRRLLVAYMSIGEAEDYRYYWDGAWTPGDPPWLYSENPSWEGNYRVAYWEPEWQAVILGEGEGYLDRILAAGFDGVYLDIVAGFEYFEALREGT